ncbi:hypothetical protein [Aliarcobacter cibarius]|uniref:Uncharacterized protein n=1 Tax=Aliarcobacter cibarius TaxID=255507 RepID=A0ABY2V983_9BACT|nr:hypothetical protein [Aliarcobacter cibarius]TLT00468.1 hypothetical protein FE247_04160 [Aliarcobacter cibarius]TLT00784.1 hypothetical protein FE245_04355 [Aliarcobacter cibarius]
MLGNIWISSALVVVTIFSAGASWKSLSDIKETKQLQEHYEIISKIKTLLAKQYNKNPEDITRDEIIAHLPNGQNWEKVLLLDRDKNSTISNKSLINKDGDIEISEDEKFKLLALKAKLKDLTDVNSITPENGKYTFEIGKSEKNAIVQDLEIQKSVDKAIHALSQDILYTSISSKSSILDSVLENFTPYEDFHFTFLKDNETSISETELKKRKQNYFKQKIKEKLYKNESSIETRLYKELESLL